MKDLQSHVPRATTSWFHPVIIRKLSVKTISKVGKIVKQSGIQCCGYERILKNSTICNKEENAEALRMTGAQGLWSQNDWMSIPGSL